MRTLNQADMPTVNTFESNKPQGLSPLAPLHVFGRKSAEGGVGATRGRRPGWGRYAFTLIELLVVIAITVILFALLLRPLVESLRLTQSAQTQAAAQDAARTTIERLTRELGSAVYVYDNASHPFVTAAAVSGIPTGARQDHFTNFLDLGVTNSDGNIVVEHAYDAKLDIVPARHSSSGTQTDPTNGNSPIQLKGGATGSATLSSTGLLFPLAPDSTIIRHFVGLKDPTKPYTNSNEGLLAAAGTSDNTYILYVAQVSPYNPSTSPKNADGTTINEKLFAPMHDSSGKVLNKPELDDPDFFRYVNLNGATDVNWLDSAHGVYPTQNPGTSPAYDGSDEDHNNRVDEWARMAKPVITAPDIDLLQLPHKSDGSIDYDTSGAFDKVAHSGVVYDALKGTAYPIVNTTVSFRPALVEGDAAPATTTDYASLGIPANAADNGGLPYVPTFYTAANKSWTYPYNMTLYPLSGSTVSPQPDTSKPYFTTGLDTTGATGDIMEYRYTSSADTAPKAVFDVTQGMVLVSTTPHDYVPLSVNPDTGTISFDTPALPAPPNMNSTVTYSPYTRFWYASAADINNGNLQASLADATAPGGHAAGVLDLTNLVCDTTGTGQLSVLTGSGNNTSPLPKLGVAPTGVQCAHAVIVPGSVRVYGPDATPGPGLGNRVLYSQVSPGTPLNYNEYRVDYLNSLIYFYVDGSHQLPETKVDPTTNTTVNADPVQIAFNYQANLSPVDATDPVGTPLSTANPANPMLVKVDYQTRDLLDISIGVRLYDTSQGRTIVIPASNRVQIGNSNR